MKSFRFSVFYFVYTSKVDCHDNGFINPQQADAFVFFKKKNRR